MIPIATDAAKAMGNDSNDATSAAAKAARTRLVSTVTWRVTIGVIKMAASPASAEPSDQLTVAMTSGDQPSDAAAR
jgi:hypothetical protein